VKETAASVDEAAVTISDRRSHARQEKARRWAGCGVAEASNCRGDASASQPEQVPNNMSAAGSGTGAAKAEALPTIDAVNKAIVWPK